MVGKFTVSDDEDDSNSAYERAKQFVDVEADCQSEDECFGDASDEEDSFIVTDEEGEQEMSMDKEKENSKGKKPQQDFGKSPKQRTKRVRDILDEDDFVMLEEHGIPRAPGKEGRDYSSSSKRLKRSGKIAMTDEESEGSGGNRAESSARGRLKARKHGHGQDSDSDFELDDEDELSDFIVDDDETSSAGKSFKRRRPSLKGFPKCLSTSSSKRFDSEDEVEVRSDVPKRVEDVFMEEGIKDSLSTVKDDQIREIDVPERMQLLQEITGPYPEDEDTYSEAVWVYDRLYEKTHEKDFKYILNLEKELLVKDISNVLNMLHDDKLEIPFIAMYRKEKCINILGERQDEMQTDWDAEDKSKLQMFTVLWAVYQLDKKWLLLQRRKNALKASFGKRIAEEASRITDNIRRLDSILKSLNNADSEHAVNDVEHKFNLMFSLDEVEMDGEFKRPKRKSFYDLCRKSGFGELSHRLGLNSEQFAENILDANKHSVEDDTSSPEDLALAFCSQGTCVDVPTVLDGARHMAAVEIAAEPVVIGFVRLIYMQNAVVTTKPTEDVIWTDSFHLYDQIKNITNKQLQLFEDHQWLVIAKAVEEKFIKVSISLSCSIIEEILFPTFERAYLSNGSGGVSELWNEQRKLVLKEALHKCILPKLEKEANLVLIDKAKSSLLQEYQKQLWKTVSAGPFRARRRDTVEEDGPDTVKECRKCVMACCQGFGKEPTAIVIIDLFGEVVETVFVTYLSARPKNPVMEKRKEEDRQRVANLIRFYQPLVAAIGASNMRCKYLKDSVNEIVSEMSISLSGLEPPEVVYVDEAYPKLYEHSSISQDQVPNKKGIVRRAVAVGRYLIDPLAMIATLFGPGREILSWKLHPMDSFLDAEERYESIEQVMVTVTNQVGIDVNQAVCHEWMLAPLQFVCGLGYRKAAFLYQRLAVKCPISNRKELFDDTLLNEVVYRNTVGFLRIRAFGLGCGIFDPLDGSRVHPESYDFARKVALLAYCELENKDMESLEEGESEKAVEYLRTKAESLRSGTGIAETVLEKMGNDKHLTFTDIFSEIFDGFQDWRSPYKEPDLDEQFTMLTGENDESLAVGRTVKVTVRRVQSTRVICNMDSGLTAFIDKQDLSVEKGADLKDFISEGSTLTCQVKCIHKDRFLAEVTCNAIIGSQSNCQIENENDNMEEERPKVRDRKDFKARLIEHPLFDNISTEEAAKLLSEKDTGEFIIRPSNRGASYLTLTLKVTDGVYAHKTIVEKNKDEKDLMSYLKLGKTLCVGGDKGFASLDELIESYVRPLVAKLKTVLANDRFTKLPLTDIENNVRQEKMENIAATGGNPFYLSASTIYPGAFLLSYMAGGNPHHEVVGLLPNGFRFRRQAFETVEDVIDHFQKRTTDHQMFSSSDYTRSSNDDNYRGDGRRGGGGFRGGRRGGGEGGGGGRRGGRRGGGRGGRFNRDRDGAAAANSDVSSFGDWQTDAGGTSRWGSGSSSSSSWDAYSQNDSSSWGAVSASDKVDCAWGTSGASSDPNQNSDWGIPSSAQNDSSWDAAPIQNDSSWGAAAADNTTGSQSTWSSRDSESWKAAADNNGDGGSEGYGRGGGYGGNRGGRRGGGRRGGRGGRRGGGRFGNRDSGGYRSSGGDRDSFSPGSGSGFAWGSADQGTGGSSGWGSEGKGQGDSHGWGASTKNRNDEWGISSGNKPQNSDATGNSGWGSTDTKPEDAGWNATSANDVVDTKNGASSDTSDWNNSAANEFKNNGGENSVWGASSDAPESSGKGNSTWGGSAEDNADNKSAWAASSDGWGGDAGRKSSSWSSSAAGGQSSWGAQNNDAGYQTGAGWGENKAAGNETGWGSSSASDGVTGWGSASRENVWSGGFTENNETRDGGDRGRARGRGRGRGDGFRGGRSAGGGGFQGRGRGDGYNRGGGGRFGRGRGDGYRGGRSGGHWNDSTVSESGGGWNEARSSDWGGGGRSGAWNASVEYSGGGRGRGGGGGGDGGGRRGRGRGRGDGRGGRHGNFRRQEETGGDQWRSRNNSAGAQRDDSWNKGDGWDSWTKSEGQQNDGWTKNDDSTAGFESKNSWGNTLQGSDRSEDYTGKDAWSMKADGGGSSGTQSNDGWGGSGAGRDSETASNW